MTKGKVILIVLGLMAFMGWWIWPKYQSHAQGDAQSNPVLYYTSQLIYARRSKMQRRSTGWNNVANRMSLGRCSPPCAFRNCPMVKSLKPWKS